MVAFLLFAILLCLCPPLRKAIGLLFWFLVILVVWHWPSDEDRAATPVPATVIERPASDSR